MRIWVNGTFDILHRGHIELLNFASSFGQVRVGLDTDRRVTQFKGTNRPVNKLVDRMYLIENLKSVHSVVSFDSDLELETQIKNWESDYIVIGGDYKNKLVIGSQLVKKVIFFERIPEYSSTKIINR